MSTTTTELQPRLIIGLGNPLLDISANDVSQETLDKVCLERIHPRCEILDTEHVR